MKENRLELIRTAVIQKDDTLLTKPQLQVKEQLQFAFKLLITGECTMGEVANALQEEFGVKSAQWAYERISEAKEVFGDVVKANRKFEAHVQYMRAEAIYKKAMDTDDLELALKAVDTMAKIRGLDKDDHAGMDPSKLEPHIYNIVLDPRMQQMVTRLLDMGRVNLTDAFGDVPLAEVETAPAPAPAPAPEAE